MLKLKIELVPSTSWYSNLRNNIKRKDWDIIRKEIYAKYDYKCGICGVSNVTLNCHEIWEYDDKNHIQKLGGFIALCNNCHMIKHIGFAGIQAEKGLLDLDKLKGHFMKVNKCTLEDFEVHREEAFKKWNERSQSNWEIDLGEYKNKVCEQSKLG